MSTQFDLSLCNKEMNLMHRSGSAAWTKQKSHIGHSGFLTNDMQLHLNYQGTNRGHVGRLTSEL